MEIAITIALAIVGAAMGSFAAATVWRIRARQLDYDKKHKEPYDKKEYAHLKKLLGKKVASDRSQCLHCGYSLKWYDLIPAVSWLSLRGKCRECRKPIGVFEIISEVGLAAYFVVLYLFWPGGLVTPIDVIQLSIWLVAGGALTVLVAYDYKWFLLPDSGVLIVGLLGLVNAALVVTQATEPIQALLSVATSVAILGGLYGVLYYASKGRWVGFGDVKLGFALGLLIADWRLAFVALFLANFIGCLIVIPMMLFKKIKASSRVPFGPLFIAGTVLALLIGPYIIDWYAPLLALPL